MDESEASSEIDPKQAKRRARWRRNKEQERKRKRQPTPQALQPAILRQVIAERDRRLSISSPWIMHLGAHNRGWGTHAFRCDVWLARTVLQLQNPSKAISSGKIARWMAENGMTHGYAHGKQSRSLQTMVYRAQKAITVLEALKVSKTGAPYWSAFTPTDTGT